MKTEPGEYSYSDLEQAGRDVWDGVKNYAALRNKKNMRPGDLAFIYHTGKEKSVVGVARVAFKPYPDPRQEGLYLVDLTAGYRLNRPVSLAEIKSDPAFANWELVRLPRLSVMPVPAEFWAKVHHMADTPQYHAVQK
ncbi:MAG: EVE domain-containing protein [Desulfotomaculaceae bacterium]|nr:EVE domain-containing protein [Desulfotomaculaceae bacterium]MDD4766650.1 EVE domain-containing protein [Desulfotomaculaceae bacterium]